ncbi:uncharacterized protein LOC122390504 isoform X2 [Amphibalanus amphitrite]|uniref:uncharacterized protein LOC122390504 isoform X2 n=1 Tax=Amphibalanus amphitrite TaxID=1232801 RepID=UPI001C9289B8|nr:uncharacterized protein LOC122390504 isoform X2 [Amphibalanus amphitrite]
MEVCPAEPPAPPGVRGKQTYSAIHGERPGSPTPVCPPAAGVTLRRDAHVVGQGDAAGRGAGVAAKDRLGVQERALGAPRRPLGAAGGRLDAPQRPVDTRERQLGAQAAVLAPPGGRPLDARPGDVAARRADGRVVPRHWRSESDLAGSSEGAEPPADSDSDSEAVGARQRQPWRSETHLAPAAGRGTLSQRHRSQPCLLAARPDYSAVSSRVAAYIQRRRQQDRAARARRRRDSDRSPDPAADAEPDVSAGGAEAGDTATPAADCRALAERLAAERAERKERERQLEQLQSQYEQLVTKYAEAETYIDRMRFQRPMGAGRPGSQAPRPSFHASDGWEVHDGKMIMISPNETHTSQSSRFSRLSGVKSAILRRHSDEESSFLRFVKSKKELFPEGVGSKDSSFSERGSVDLNDSVKNLVEEGHLYHMRCSPVSVSGCVLGGERSPSAELRAAPAGWGPTSAPPVLPQYHSRHRHPSQALDSGDDDRTGRYRREGEGTGETGRVQSGEEGEGEEKEVREREKQVRRSSGSKKGRGSTGSSAHNRAVKADVRDEKWHFENGVSIRVGSRSRGSSSEDLHRSRGEYEGHAEQSHDLSAEHHHRSRDSPSLNLNESRDHSIEKELSSQDSEPSPSSVSSRDPSPEQRHSSRDSDMVSPEPRPNKMHGSKSHKHHCLSNSAEENSVGSRQSSSDRKRKTRSLSHDIVPSPRPQPRVSSPRDSRSSLISEHYAPSVSRISEHNNPSVSLTASRASRSHISDGSESPRHSDRHAKRRPMSSSLSRLYRRRRRRSSSEPGFRGASHTSTDTAAAVQPASKDPPASRDRLQGVLSVLASQVEVIQAMVAHRGRSSRTARRCRSLSRRISRNRVSVSPGGVLDRAEVVGVPVTRRVTSKGRYEGEDAGCERSESVGRRVVDWSGGCTAVDWTGGQSVVDRTGGRGEGETPTGRRSNKSAVEPARSCAKAAACREERSQSPSRCAGQNGGDPAPQELPVRRRHPAGVGSVPEGDLALGRLSPHSVSDGGVPPQDGRAEPSAGTGGAAERCVAPPAGCQPGGFRGSASAEGDAQRTAVPPLPLSELESEHGDGAGSYCSLMSPRTVSPTRKVEQWRARLAEVSPEPPPDGRPAAGEPTPCRPGPELRRLAGAVRGLQRQMSGFCRLVDELRTPVTPVTPVTPGSPGSSEASGARRRRRYLRERRGLQLPLLPDKPAPLAAEPARLQCSAPPPARRWDIRRPAPRRAASCERAVQTETEAAAPTACQPRPAAVSRSDGELTSATASAKYRDVLAPWDRASLLAREVNLRSRCILEGVIRSTAC